MNPPDARLSDAALRIPRADELFSILAPCTWLFHRLDVAGRVNPPEWWIGAGAIRDVVWDTRFGNGFDPGRVKDVDLRFFDASDLSADRDRFVEAELSALDPGTPWDVKNQAAVHLWYPKRFGKRVQPFHSTAEAVSTFPEPATCVAITTLDGRRLHIAAPLGLDDLLEGVWRRNPARVTLDEYQRRLRAKNPMARWPGVRVVGWIPRRR